MCFPSIIYIFNLLNEGTFVVTYFKWRIVQNVRTLRERYGVSGKTIRHWKTNRKDNLWLDDCSFLRSLRRDCSFTFVDRLETCKKSGDKPSQQFTTKMRVVVPPNRCGEPDCLIVKNLFFCTIFLLQSVESTKICIL